MPWFTGMVHGVVVQTTARTYGSLGGAMPKLTAARRLISLNFEAASRIAGQFGASTISNATSIWVETMSSYSISASASAVLSTGDHMTGLAPRYSWSVSANLNSSETMVASA